MLTKILTKKTSTEDKRFQKEISSKQMVSDLSKNIMWFGQFFILEEKTSTLQDIKCVRTLKFSTLKFCYVSLWWLLIGPFLLGYGYNFMSVAQRGSQEGHST